MLAQLIAEVEAFIALIRRGAAVNVNDQSSKDCAIALATRYFNEIRPQVTRLLGETTAIVEHDNEWQQLVRLAHGKNSRKSYLKTLRALRKALSELNIAALSGTQLIPATQGIGRGALSPEEVLIVQTLDALIPSAAASYRQGLADLVGGERLSYRGTAAEFREALRETLDHLAPDTDVTAQSWFKLESPQTGPTMKQKVRFVLSNRGRNKTQREAAEKSLVLIDQLSGDVMRAIYNRASLATHVHESRQEVQKIKRYVDTVLFDLLEVAI